MLLNACKGIDLAINIGKTKYMAGEHHWGMMTNEHITVGNNFYEKGGETLNI